MSKSIKINKPSNKSKKDTILKSDKNIKLDKHIKLDKYVKPNIGFTCDSSDKVKLTKKNTSKKIANINPIDDSSFEEKIEDIRKALKNNYIEQKKLMNELKILLSLHKKEVKLSSKTKKRSNSGKHSGFNKPEPVPLPLKKLLKIKEDNLPRSKITNLMYQYFRDNNMYNSETKKEIIPNSHIKKIFEMKKGDIVNFYNMQTWLKKVYNKNSSNGNILKIDD